LYDRFNFLTVLSKTVQKLPSKKLEVLVFTQQFMKIIIKDTNEPSVDTVTQKTIMDEKEIDIGSSEYLINRTSA